jgi:hypothetical protein
LAAYQDRQGDDEPLKIIETEAWKGGLATSLVVPWAGREDGAGSL